MSINRKLFHDNPTMTVDNYFVADAVIDWGGNKCLEIIGTNARNSLPKDIKTFYPHKENTNTTMKHSKAEILFYTIVAVKNDSTGFQCVHVYFQSTPSYNVEYVNDLNECTNFVEIHNKGSDKNKFQWMIEINHSQRIYLATYFCIDVLDGRIQNAHIFSRVWKYWHSPMNHFLLSQLLPHTISN